MAHDEPTATLPTRLVIRNIGLLLSGRLEQPILDADTILAENGRITAIGRAADIDTAGATTVIDAHGTTVTPGLIDSHVHPSPATGRRGRTRSADRQFSQRRRHHHDLRGRGPHARRPRDVVGLKAMAIFAQRAFDNFRPGGSRSMPARR